MPVSININKEMPVDVVTDAEKNAGMSKVNVAGDKSVNVNATTSIAINDNKKTYKGNLNFSKAINGDIMIFDHGFIDIIILKEQKKVVAFAKDMLTDNVYGAESRLFDHLRKKGIVAYDSIQGGNIYGSMEAQMLSPDKNVKEPLTLTIHEIQEWIKTEKPIFNSLEAHDDLMDDALLNPDDEHTTELGEVPHEEEKGSIVQKNMFAPYLYGRYTY
jgi:hypothetical protein